MGCFINDVFTKMRCTRDNLLCPYQGLFHFSPKEAEYFFGRDVFIEELFKATQTRNFIPVLGASGSGKSSVVLAGLVPKLVKAGHWQFTHFRPGKKPFLALAQALVPLYRSDLDSTDTIIQARKLARSFSDDELPLSDVFATIHRNHPNQRILLIADQFEELYNPSIDEHTRRQFLDTLVNTFQSSPQESSLSRVLVATLRIDFLGNALSYPTLADVLRDTDVKIRSMNPEELREVIEKPAQKLGVSFESGLVERILKDVDKEPGNLPLLEFALTELWKKRTSKQLTHQAYQEIGEVSGALTSYADREFSKFKPEEQERVRRIFIQLVRPGEGTEDTRRLATKAELKQTNWNLVKNLADTRLVVTSRTVVTSAENAEQETVEVVHEALIRNWGQLKGWMETDREFRAWQERIRATMGHWQEMNRDKGLLLRGGALVQAQEKLKERREELSQAEQEFIDLSEALQVREEKQKQRQRQRIIGGLVAFSITISGLAATVFGLWRDALIGKENANIKAEIAKLKSRLVLGEKTLDVQLDVIKLNQELQQAKKPTKDILIKGANLLQQTVSQRREINHFSGHQDSLYDVIFSPDGKYLASVSTDKTVKLWTREGELLETLSGVWAVTFSRDGKYLAASADKTVKVWTREGELLETLSGHQGPVNHVTFSRDGKYLASASSDKTVKLWTAEGQLLETLSGHQDLVVNVTFSPDGKYLASASYDKTVKLWTAKGQLVDTLSGHQDSVSDVTFSPDGKYLASKSVDLTVKLWTAEGDLVKTFRESQDSVNDVTFSRDGKYLASASADKTVKLWTTQGELVDTLREHERWGNHVTFSPDRKYFASETSGNTVKLWTAKGELLDTLSGHQGPVYDVTFSPDGKYLASASADKTVKLWTTQGKLLETLSGHQGPVNHVTFSPDSKYLASASADKTVKLWTTQGELVDTLSGHQDSVEHVTFSPDGKYLASTSSDKTVKLWTAEGKLLDTLIGHQDWITDVTFSPDGKYLASASSDKTVKLWTTQGELVDTLIGHQDRVYDVTFSRDGKYLASASEDKTVKLWTAEGELVETLITHQDRGYNLTFSPDGKYLASASANGTIKLWNFNREELLKQACNGLNDYLKNNPNVSDEKRSLCQVEASSTALRLQGEELAKNGKIEQAIYKFKKALELDPSLEFDPQTEAIKIQALFLVNEGYKLAWEGKIEQASYKFKKALELDPSLEFDPQTKAKQVLAQFYFIQGNRLAKNGKIEQAIPKFKKALELDPSLEFDPGACHLCRAFVLEVDYLLPALCK